MQETIHVLPHCIAKKFYLSVHPGNPTTQVRLFIIVSGLENFISFGKWLNDSTMKSTLRHHKSYLFPMMSIMLLKFFGCVCNTVMSLATFGCNVYRELRSVTVSYLAVGVSHSCDNDWKWPGVPPEASLSKIGMRTATIGTGLRTDSYVNQTALDPRHGWPCEPRPQLHDYINTPLTVGCDIRQHFLHRAHDMSPTQKMYYPFSGFVAKTCDLKRSTGAGKMKANPNIRLYNNSRQLDCFHRCKCSDEIEIAKLMLWNTRGWSLLLQPHSIRT